MSARPDKLAQPLSGRKVLCQDEASPTIAVLAQGLYLLLVAMTWPHLLRSVIPKPGPSSPALWTKYFKFLDDNRKTLQALQSLERICAALSSDTPGSLEMTETGSESESEPDCLQPPKQEPLPSTMLAMHPLLEAQLHLKLIGTSRTRTSHQKIQ